MTANSPRLPRRSVWDPELVDDGSRTTVDLATGEIVEIPPSKQRALRLAARTAAHEARQAEAREAAAERARAWADVARAALPKRTPIGLQR